MTSHRLETITFWHSGEPGPTKPDPGVYSHCSCGGWSWGPIINPGTRDDEAVVMSFVRHIEQLPERRGTRKQGPPEP